MTRQADNRQMVMPFTPALGPAWRPIHYLGSKLRLTGAIRELVSELDPGRGTVCDLFAGSGTVAMALSAERTVVAADIQEYSRVLCTALLHPASLSAAEIGALNKQSEGDGLAERLEHCLLPILRYEERAMDEARKTPDLLCDLVERGSLLGKYPCSDPLGVALSETRSRISSDKAGGFLMATHYFGGTYFSFRQSMFMDVMLDAIEKLPPRLRDTVRAALLSTASSIVNTIGKHFAQPIRPRHKDGTAKLHLVEKMLRDRRLDAGHEFAGWLSRYSGLSTTGSHRVVRGDFREVLAGLTDVGVIYADPPYTRDHYSRFYHVLETLCECDFPSVAKTNPRRGVKLSRGVYRTDRHQSPFCIKSQAPSAFDELFSGAKAVGASMLLSYSPYIKDGHPRLMTMEAITRIAARHYSRVRIVPAIGMSHSKLNKSELHLETADNAEVFVICQV